MTNGSPGISPPPDGQALLENVPAASFTDFLFSDADIAVLKSLARARGSYYQGSQDWTSPPPNGIIFVDTPSGQPFTNSSPASDLITVDIHGNWSEAWSGWLIVAGSGQINGISTNRRDVSSTNIDTEDTGNAPIRYDCKKVRNGGGAVTQNWFVKPGTYQEPSGS